MTLNHATEIGKKNWNAFFITTLITLRNIEYIRLYKNYTQSNK